MQVEEELRFVVWIKKLYPVLCTSNQIKPWLDKIEFPTIMDKMDKIQLSMTYTSKFTQKIHRVEKTKQNRSPFVDKEFSYFDLPPNFYFRILNALNLSHYYKRDTLATVHCKWKFSFIVWLEVKKKKKYDTENH